jgi:hypothetical protein
MLEYLIVVKPGIFKIHLKGFNAGTGDGINVQLSLNRSSGHTVKNIASVLSPRPYKQYHLSAILYGYETWSAVLREQHRLLAFENRAMRYNEELVWGLRFSRR